MPIAGDQITQTYWDWTRSLQTARLWESIGGDGFGKCVPDRPFAHAAGGFNISVSESLVLPFGVDGVQTPTCIVRQFSTFATESGSG